VYTAASSTGSNRAGINVRGLLSHPTTRRILSLPTLGCLLGALVGGLAPLRGLFLSKGAPLGPLFEALRTLGAAYLPTVLLVLAGSLAQGLKTLDSGVTQYTAGRNERTPEVTHRDCIAAGVLRKLSSLMLSRFILMPCTAFMLVTGGLRAGFIPNDKILLLVLLMAACMPRFVQEAKPDSPIQCL
jgi:X-X-X-Leu-X-X-Gly heptad repeat protein